MKTECLSPYSEMIQTNFECFFEIMSRKSVKTPELKYVFSNIPHPNFNSVLRTNAPEDKLDEIIKNVTANYNKEMAKHCWWVTELDSRKNLAEKLIKNHYAPSDRFIGLSLDLSQHHIKQVEHKDFMVLPITEIDQLTYWIYPFLEHNNYKNLLSRRTFEQYKAIFEKETNLFHFVVFYKNKPVGCGSLLITGECAGFYNVGYINQSKRNTIVELLKMARLELAQKNHCTTVVMQVPETLYKKGFYADFERQSTYQAYLYHNKPNLPNK